MHTYVIKVCTDIFRYKYFALAKTTSEAIDAALAQFETSNAIGVTAHVIRSNK